ncbi:MAG: DUF1828 domain-containing protein [bacterium]
MNDCNAILEMYLSAVRQHSEILRVGEQCAILTPYLHSNGVSITIFAQQGPENKVRLHDNGETLQSLFSRGVKIFDNEHRLSLLQDICRSYSVEYSGWVLFKDSVYDQIGDGMIDLINALKSINDMVFLHQVSTSDILRFAVEVYFKEKQLDVVNNYKLLGKTTIHKVDFYRKTESKEKFVNVLSGSNLQNKTIKLGFSYYDVKEMRKSGNWISIINPEDKWAPQTLKLLGNFSEILSWEHKDKLLDILSN